MGRTVPLEKLELLARQKLTLVSAPMGYGKTGLLVEFARKKAKEGRLVSWLTMDEEDVDLARFRDHVVAALGRFGAEAAETIGPLAPVGEQLEHGAGLDRDVLVAIGNALFEALPPGIPCYLVIDEYGCAGRRSLDAQMLRFCSLTPPDFHVVLASSAFSWALQTDAYRLGFGCLAAEDLALTFDEARQLADAVCNEPCTDYINSTLASDMCHIQIRANAVSYTHLCFFPPTATADELFIKPLHLSISATPPPTPSSSHTIFDKEMCIRDRPKPLSALPTKYTAVLAATTCATAMYATYVPTRPAIAG